MAAKTKSKKVSVKSSPTIHNREKAGMEVLTLGFMFVAVLFLGVSWMVMK